MSTYKTILFLCSNKSKRLITELVNYQSVNYDFTSDIEEFSQKLAQSPDAVVVCSSMIDQSFIDTFSSSLRRLNTAVLVSDGETDKVTAMMDAGLSTFISGKKITEGLTSFFDKVLASDIRSGILAKALRRMRKLADNTNDSLIIIDKAQDIAYVNKSTVSLLNIERVDLLNKKLTDVFKVHPFALDKDSEQPQHYDEFEFETINGDKITLSGTGSPIYDKDVFSGAVIILNKISSNQEDRQKELELLKYQQRYHSAQQNIAFKKQMLILKDEMSNIKTGNFAIETYFKPLDILSGDSYGSINLKDGRYLFYIIDAMGKGLSASVTALQSISFINHSIELSLLKDDFDLEKTVASFLYYIRDRLMDEEALCCAFTLVDSNKDTLTFANYGLPPIYTSDTEGHVEMYRPNNLPIMRCITGKNVETISLHNIEKILISSDGLAESFTKDNGLYSDLVKEHLSKAITKKHFLSMVNSTIQSNNDDITFFFIKKDNNILAEGNEYIIKSSMDEVFKLCSILSEQMTKDGIPETESSTVEFAISEILMNALEHGNLGLNFQEKQNLIASNEYDDFLKNACEKGSDNYDKKIRVKYEFQKESSDRPGILLLSVTDEGKGFTPANLFKFHTFDGNLCYVDKASYNGRGIFISDNILDGLYYNEEGNCAFLLKIIKA